MAEPTLDPKSQRVLQVMMQKPMLSGGELANRAALAPAEILDAVKPLMERGYVESSGELFDAESILRAYFSLLPSARRYLAMTLK